ncbi:hypothetical protein JCM3766R1_001597 [Sporobolomyces carnicolor]
MSLSRTALGRLISTTSGCAQCRALSQPRIAFARHSFDSPPTSSSRFRSFSTPSRPARAAPISNPSLERTPPPAVTVGPAAATQAKPKRVIRARKAAVSLTPNAVTRIRALLDSPTPKLIRVGVRNKGCAGMSYHLEYVDRPEKFDEIVEQDGVKVVIDSKALFSIIGSEMDWQEDALQARFVFNNPNIKDACGCGESFIV